MEDLRKYEPLFGSWTVDRILGEGSFGKVYALKKTDFGKEYFSALKVISIPQSTSEISSMRTEGMDDQSIRMHYDQFVKDVVSEFDLMSKFRGNSNIVSYEDHMVLPHESGFGYDILIRMELLTSLVSVLEKNKFTRKDVIQLGIDMCKALELCQKYNIIHRDIKPENIFVSDNGDYKLGDFGIARTVEKTAGEMSKKGTYTYMAPEVYKGEAYGSDVDIYSLGIVMYRLLNGNRTPFLPPHPAPITHTDRENALMQRINGSKIPLPGGADGRLAEIVMKSIEYSSKDRFVSPMQMRKELEVILYTENEGPIIYPAGDRVELPANQYISAGGNAGGATAAGNTAANQVQMRPQAQQPQMQPPPIQPQPQVQSRQSQMTQGVPMPPNARQNEPSDMTVFMPAEATVAEPSARGGMGFVPPQQQDGQINNPWLKWVILGASLFVVLCIVIGAWVFIPKLFSISTIKINEDETVSDTASKGKAASETGNDTNNVIEVTGEELRGNENNNNGDNVVNNQNPDDQNNTQEPTRPDNPNGNENNQNNNGETPPEPTKPDGPDGNNNANNPTPTEPPTPAPTQRPTPAPTQPPTPAPTQRPTPAPTQPPTPAPTQRPTPAPTQPPTPAPTQRPTPAPTQRPTPAPTQPPTPAPTQRPTPAPTQPPTPAPTQRPTPAPTQPPTPAPTQAPTQPWNGRNFSDKVWNDIANNNYTEIVVGVSYGIINGVKFSITEIDAGMEGDILFVAVGVIVTNSLSYDISIDSYDFVCSAFYDDIGEDFKIPDIVLDVSDKVISFPVVAKANSSTYFALGYIIPYNTEMAIFAYSNIWSDHFGKSYIYFLTE